MKKLASSLCFVLTAIAAIPLAMAAEPMAGTVVYHGKGYEEFDVAMPQYLKDSNSAEININGMWPSNRQMLISIDQKYDNSVLFAGILIQGKNTTKSSGSGIITTKNFYGDEEAPDYLEIDIELKDTEQQA